MSPDRNTLGSGTPIHTQGNPPRPHRRGRDVRNSHPHAGQPFPSSIGNRRREELPSTRGATQPVGFAGSCKYGTPIHTRGNRYHWNDPDGIMALYGTPIHTRGNHQGHRQHQRRGRNSHPHAGQPQGHHRRRRNVRELPSTRGATRWHLWPGPHFHGTPIHTRGNLLLVCDSVYHVKPGKKCG